MTTGRAAGRRGDEADGVGPAEESLLVAVSQLAGTGAVSKA